MFRAANMPLSQHDLIKLQDVTLQTSARVITFIKNITENKLT